MKTINLTKTVSLQLLLLNNTCIDPLNCDFSFSIITEAESNSENDLDNARLNQNISFAKAVTFVESFINESILYRKADEELYGAILTSMENNVITLPELSEITLLAALHCKLNSIIGENSHITSVHLFDKVNNLNFTYSFLNEGEGYFELPTTEEWVHEHSYWDTPWWERNDVYTMDRIAETKEEHEKWMNSDDRKTALEVGEALFADIENEFTNLFNEDSGEAEIIEVDFTANRFKPKLVD